MITDDRSGGAMTDSSGVVKSSSPSQNDAQAAVSAGRRSARCRSHRSDSRNRAIEYRGDKQAGAQHTHDDGQAVQAVIARSFAI